MHRRAADEGETMLCAPPERRGPWFRLPRRAAWRCLWSPIERRAEVGIALIQIRRLQPRECSLRRGPPALYDHPVPGRFPQHGLAPLPGPSRALAAGRRAGAGPSEVGRLRPSEFFCVASLGRGTKPADECRGCDC